MSNMLSLIPAFLLRSVIFTFDILDGTVFDINRMLTVYGSVFCSLYTSKLSLSSLHSLQFELIVPAVTPAIEGVVTDTLYSYIPHLTPSIVSSPVFTAAFLPSHISSTGLKPAPSVLSSAYLTHNFLPGI